MGPAPPCPASRAISTSIARRCGAGCAGMSRRTGRSGRPCLIDPYRAYLDQRWSEGCRNAAAWPANSIALGLVSIHEWCALGRRRGRRAGGGTLDAGGQGPAPRGSRPARGGSPGFCRATRGDSRRGWRVHRAPEAHCTEMANAADLAVRFARMLRGQSSEPVTDWLAAARSSVLSGLLPACNVMWLGSRMPSPAVVDRASGGRDQPTEDDQATDVWPRRLRTPASARPQRGSDPPHEVTQKPVFNAR